MKRIVLLIVACLMLLAAVPAVAAPSENANLQALQAQSLKICREMMKDAVKAGDMTNDQLKTCLQMMKTSPCTGMVN